MNVALIIILYIISLFYVNPNTELDPDASIPSSSVVEDILTSTPDKNEENVTKENPLENLFLNVKNINYIDLPLKIDEYEIEWFSKNDIVSITNNKVKILENGTSIISAKANGFNKDFEIEIVENKIVKTVQNGLPIYYKFLKKTYKIGPSMTPDTLVLHNTANNASAKNEVTYLNSSENTTSTSFHFAVDESNAYQAIPLTHSAYHAGNPTVNKKSIGIEIARSTSSNIQIKNKAIENSIILINMLTNEYNIQKNSIITHKDASGKHCPHDIYDRYGINNVYDKIKSEN